MDSFCAWFNSRVRNILSILFNLKQFIYLIWLNCSFLRKVELSIIMNFIKYFLLLSWWHLTSSKFLFSLRNEHLSAIILAGYFFFFLISPKSRGRSLTGNIRLKNLVWKRKLTFWPSNWICQWSLSYEMLMIFP